MDVSNDQYYKAPTRIDLLCCAFLVIVGVVVALSLSTTILAAALTRWGRGETLKVI